MSFLFIFLQRIAPQKLISTIAGYLAESKIYWWKTFFIKKFIKQYRVDMSEALLENPNDYANFNAFFTRALKQGARSICPGNNTIACPADGMVSQIGKINHNKIFQAKGHNFTTAELLGGDEELAGKFDNGSFTTIYLSPKDYHRVHMPIAGTLQSMIHVPGRLFSVNTITTERVPGLFARNERMIAIFETAIGPFALVMVGAMIVGSIETVWAGRITSDANRVSHTSYLNKDKIQLEKGAEAGRFSLGSTAILLFPENTVDWNSDLGANSPVVMGQILASAVTI